MPLEAVIFDFDGVLVGTPHYYFKHMCSYFKERNFHISDEDVSNLVGHTFTNKLEYLKKNYGVEIDKGNFVKVTPDALRAEMVSSLILDQHLGELLKELKSKSIKMAIASSNSLKNIDFFISCLGILDFFSEIVTIGSAISPKPSPETYLRAVEVLEVKKENCVAIEDTIAGLESAKGAGIKCVVIPNKFALSSGFSKADIIVKKFDELKYNVLRGIVK